jgi:glycosyltransferase involved in cell wall biosynthesis
MQIFVDVSELIHRDAKSGIQRVVKNIYYELRLLASKNISIVPVYGLKEKPGYYVSKQFKQNLNLDDILYPAISHEDLPTSFSAGDIFLGLDFQPEIVPLKREFYTELSKSGVKIIFVVYDILSLTMPQFFPEGAEENFEKWLRSVFEVTDEILCISQVVANECSEWLQINNPSHKRELRILSWNLGANFQRLRADEEDSSLIDIVGYKNFNSKKINFISVGTIEPRKAHIEILDAFDFLWEQGFDINLIFVGKRGWNVEGLVSKIQAHPRFNKELFWFDNLSDSELEGIYKIANCLIAASHGEGYGLPIIEAAHRNIPIICRDIAIFHEVAADNVQYTSAQNTFIFAEDIKKWLTKFDQGLVKKSCNIKCISWQESARQLLNQIQITL